MPQPRLRWMAAILTILSAVIVIGLVFGKRLWVHDNIHQSLQRRAAAITAALNEKGARVTDTHLVDGLPGVEQVVALEVDGKQIRLLEFDVSKEAQAAELKHIHEKHSTKVLGAERPAEDEGGIVIIDFEDHPRKEQLLDAFHKGGSGK